MIELTEEQLLRADANADGKVNLKDSTRIRQHLANRVPLGTVTDPDDSSSDNSSGSDSNSGGSSSSGGSGESSDSSGGSEESSSSSSSGGWLPGIW